MASGVWIKRSITGEVAFLTGVDGDTVRVASELEVARRFDLVPGEFKIFEDGGEEGTQISALCRGVGDLREWYLKSGLTYFLYAGPPRKCFPSNVVNGTIHLSDFLPDVDSGNGTSPAEETICTTTVNLSDDTRADDFTGYRQEDDSGNCTESDGGLGHDLGDGV